MLVNAHLMVCFSAKKANFFLLLKSYTIASTYRARSDPTHQHFGQSTHGHYYQNSYTQTGSYMHVLQEGFTNRTNSRSSLNAVGSNGGYMITCSSAMDCESPVASTTNLVSGFPQPQPPPPKNGPSKSWAPTSSSSLTLPPSSMTSSYRHAHLQRLNHHGTSSSTTSNIS